MKKQNTDRKQPSRPSPCPAHSPRLWRACAKGGALLCLLVALSGRLLGQSLPMRHLNEDKGLPNLEVYNLMQDKRGHIWIGSDGGLFRYDGREFRAYTHPDLRSRAASRLQQQGDTIWAANFSGQIMFVAGDSLQLFGPLAELGKDYDQTQGMYDVRQAGQLWTLGTKHLFSYDFAQRAWQRIAPDSTDYVLDVKALDAGRQLYLLGDDKKDKSGSLHRLYERQSDGSKRLLWQAEQSRWVAYNFWPLGGQRFIVYTSQHYGGERVAAYLYADGRLRILPLAEAMVQDQILSFATLSNGEIWIGTHNGLWRCDQDFQVLDQPKLLPGRSISNIMETQEGDIWLATLSEGIYVLPNAVAPVYTELSANNSPAVFALAELSDGYLALGLDNGEIGVFDKASGRIAYRVGEGAGRNRVEALYYDAPTRRLYSTRAVLAWQGKALKALRPWSITLLKSAQRYKGHLIVGAVGTTYTPWVPTPAREPAIWEGDIPNFSNARNRAVCADTLQRRVWVACDDDLRYYDEAGREHIVRPGGQALSGRALAQSADGLLWVGTFDQGLYALQGDSLRHHFGPAEGLPAGACRVLLARHDTLWVGTEKGIAVLAYRTRQVMRINQLDGLVSDDVRALSLDARHLWVGTPKGLQRWPLDYDANNRRVPRAEILGLALWEAPQPLRDSYVFGHADNNLRIDFWALALRSQGQFGFEYRLLPLDSTWTYVPSSLPSARYPSLPPGRYRFELRTVNEDGLRSAAPSVLHIRIRPPYWQTWWFGLLLLLAIGGALGLLVQLRLRRLRADARLRAERDALELEKSQVEQELRASELAALKVQMNPHFMFNALNSIQEFIFNNEKLQANNYIGKFADLMRLTLDMSTERQVRLSDELEMLELYLELEKLRFHDNFSYHIEVDAAIDPEELYLPSMIVQPYVENAIKHGLLHRKGQRELHLAFRLLPDERLYAEVTDNGIGRQQSALLKQQGRIYRSFAMGATSRRLRLLNYGRQQPIGVDIVDLEDPATGAALGTSVRLYLPLDYGNGALR